ncbi:1-deoxy-D-xylulose-5-phosphate synthase [Verrucomicrobiota bacterium]
MKPRIMYIEVKPRGGRNSGPARIGRVHFSQSGSILYYGGRALEKVREEGDVKANYADMVTGDRYWVSGCKKKGGDRLQPGIIEIDDDVREEYWTEIREMPECKDQASIKSAGKRGGKQGRRG